MAVRRVRLRRGTTAENTDYTGVIGEVTVDTDKKTLHVHDGTAGGKTLLRSDMSNNASIATDINFTNADRTIGGAMTDDGAQQNPTPTVLTLGGAGSKVLIAGSLEVTGNTTQAQSLLVESRVIQIADGAEADLANTNDVGLFFTRSAGANKGLFFWDEAGDTFKLGLDGNDLAPTAIDFDTDDVNYTPASLSLGSLNVNDGDITNVSDIALDTISADGNTIGMTLKQAGGATAFTIVDDDAAGTGEATFLTINATDGSDSVTIDSTSFVVNSTTISLDNSVVINNTGAAKNFTVKGDNQANLLHTDGTNDRVGINNANPTVQLDVVGDTLITGTTSLNGAVVINESGADVDFRVEGGTDQNLLHVDASADAVGISTNTPSKTLDVAGTFGVSLKSTLAGSLDLTTASSDGITFRSEIAENGADADATLLRVNIGGTDGGGNPNYKAVSWDADTDRFTFDTDAQILNGGLVLGDGTNATTISVVDQIGGGNTLGEHLTISAGKGQGTEAGGSIIFQTQSAAAGALTTVLTLDKDNKATFTGNIDFYDTTVLGSSVGNNESMTLGGHTGSTVTTAGNLTVTSALTVQGIGATALDFTNDNITIGGSVVNGAKTITLGGGAIVATAGDLTVGGNIDFSDGATLGGSVVDGDTLTLGGHVGSTVKTAGDLTVEGSDISLGTATTTAHASISLPNTTAAQDGRNLTISSGVGSAGDGTNDGSLILRSGATPVLELDTTEKATFAGDIDFSDGTTLGGSVVDGDTLTLGGHVDSTTNVAGILQVTSNTIKSSGATAITLSDDDATVLGGLTITGTGIAPSAGGLGGAGQLVIGAGGGTDSHLTAAHSPTDGANDIASGNFIISAGKSVGNGAGGSIVFQTSESGAGNQTANALQTVLTLDKDKLATFTGNIKLGSTGVIVSNNGDNAITLSNDDVTVLGDLSITGASSQKVNLGATDDGTAFEIAMQPRVAGGGNDLAGANLTITAGRSVGNANGGSIFFQTSERDTDGNGQANNVLNNLQTVLTLDTTKKATFAGNVLISGNLEVDGTTTQIDSTISTYVDPMILLNKDDLADTDIGVFMGREATDGHNVAMYWDHGESTFAFASTSADASDTDVAVDLSAQANYALQPVKALSIGMGTTTTTASNEIQTRSATAFVVMGNAQGGADTGNNLVVDTIDGQIETLKIVPLAHNTHDIGADANRFATGYFTSLDTTSNVQFDGTVNLGTDADGQDKDITVVARTGADKTGNDLTITAGQSTGTGAGGSLKFVTSATGGASNANANALQTVLTLDTDNLATFGDAIKIGGNSIQSSGGTEAIALSADNTTTTISASTTTTISATTTKTSGDLTVEGGDVTLGTAGGGATTISVPTTNLGGAGHALTISSGLGNNPGVNDGSLILRSGSTTVLTLDTAELATFAGNIKVGTNVIQSSNGDNTITLDEDDATVLGGLTITGTGIVPSAGGLGGAGQLVIGAGVGADSHLTATHSIAGGDNDIASGNFIISAGKSVGEGAGGSIIFQTSESDTAGVGGAGNGLNDLQTVLTLDNAKLATFAGAIDVTTTSILRGNTSLYSSADLTVYSDAGTTDKFSVAGATGNTSIAGTLGVTGITTLDDTLKIKTSPTDSIGILFNSDTADADITLLKVNDTTANVQLDWDNSEDSFVVKGGKLHSETDFSVGGTITTNPNFKVDSSGNVTIKGTLSTTSASGHVSFRDRIIALATNSASATNDIGFYGLYKNDNVNEAEYYTGLIYHPVDTVGNNGKLGVWKLFHSESVGADAVNVDVEDTNLGVLDISELRGGSALGNNDTAGADLTISGGKSTGSATGGGIVFKTGGSGAGAAVENTPATALTLDNAKKATFEGEVEVDRGGSKYSVVTVKASEGSRYECASPAFAGNAVTISAPDAVENKHAYFLSNGATAGTVNLFDLTAGYDGYVLQIFNTGTNTLTVDGSGAQEVDGAETKDVAQGASLTLMAYGLAWYVV